MTAMAISQGVLLGFVPSGSQEVNVLILEVSFTRLDENHDRALLFYVC